MSTVDQATVALIAGPLVGAGMLLILDHARAVGDSGSTRKSLIRAIVALATLAVTVAGLAWIVGAAIAKGPEAQQLTLGAADPAHEVATAAWSLAPAALSLLFVGIGLYKRSLLLIGLAVIQALITIPVAILDLTSAAPLRTGASFVSDPLSVLLLVVSVGVGGLIVVFSLGYEPAHLDHLKLPVERTNAFVAWLLIFLASMHLLVLANDLRALAVGWEMTTLCSFVLIGFDGSSEADTAARRALAYNLLGGVGLALALVVAGPHATLASLLGGERSLPVLTLILAGMVIAAATKSALVPFHPWLLGAMVAATPVSALLHASTMVKAGVYLLLRLSPALGETPFLASAVVVLGGFSFSMAAFLALRERDLKRVLALSTVASLGLIAASAGLNSPLALAAGALLLGFHAFAKGLAFLVVGGTEQLTGTRDLEALVGLARVRASLAGPLVLAGAAMALPPFAIAVGKWVLLVEVSGRPLSAALLALGTATNVALWTAVVARLLNRRRPDIPLRGQLPIFERVPIAMLALGTAAGLVLAGPVSALVADPVAQAAFGHAAPLAAGSGVIRGGSLFPVMPIALLVLGVALVAVLVASRVAAGAVPYLGGANVGRGATPAFHAPRGDTQLAASGGFTWGAALGEGTEPATLHRLVAVTGWVGVSLVSVIAATIYLTGGMP
jgi:ech hydrogenase subunit A